MNKEKLCLERYHSDAAMNIPIKVGEDTFGVSMTMPIELNNWQDSLSVTTNQYETLYSSEGKLKKIIKYETLLIAGTNVSVKSAISTFCRDSA